MLERRVDWNGIVRALAIAAKDSVWFEHMVFEAEEGAESNRVEIEIRGYSMSQGSVRSFVVAVEKLGLFDEIVLNETLRVVINESDQVQFKATLILDPSLDQEGKE